MFVHDLKKLLEQAMPGLEENARNQLLLHQFLSGLPEAASKQLRVGGEVKALDTAISRARLIMTVDEPGRNAAATVAEKPSEVEALKEQIALLTEQVAALSTTAAQPRNASQPRSQ